MSASLLTIFFHWFFRCLYTCHLFFLCESISATTLTVNRYSPSEHSRAVGGDATGMSGDGLLLGSIDGVFDGTSDG